MSSARTPTRLTWLCLAALSVAVVFVTFRVIPGRTWILGNPSDAFSIIAWQEASLVLLFAVVLRTKTALGAVAGGIVLHWAALAAAFCSNKRFMLAIVAFEVALGQYLESAVNSVTERWPWPVAVMLAVAVVLTVAVGHGLVALWLASTCRRNGIDARPDTPKRSRSSPVAVKMQYMFAAAVVLAVPWSVGSGTWREAAAVDRLRAVGAVVKFFPTNPLIDRLFGTRARVYLTGRQSDDAALAEVAHLRRLDCLTIQRCAITDDGLENLSGLRDLRMLFILDCPITDAGLMHLRPLQSLFLAGFFGDQLSAAGIGKLEDAWRYHTSVVYDHRARVKH